MLDSNPKNILPKISTAEARRERYSKTGKITEADVLEYLNEVRQILSKDYEGDELEERLRATEEKTRLQYKKELQESKPKSKKKNIPTKPKIEETDSIVVVDKENEIKKIKPQVNENKASGEPLGMKDLSRGVGGVGIVTKLGGSLFNRMFPTLGRFLDGVQSRIARNEKNLTETNSSTQGYAQQVGRSSVFLSSMIDNQAKTNDLLQQIVNITGENVTPIPQAPQPTISGQNSPTQTNTTSNPPAPVNRPQPQVPTQQTLQNTSAVQASTSTSTRISPAGRAAIIGGDAVGSMALASSGAAAAVNPRSSITSDQTSSASQNVSGSFNTQTQTHPNVTPLQNEPVSGQEANNFSSRLLNINAREIVFKADKYEFDQPNVTSSARSQQQSFSSGGQQQSATSGSVMPQSFSQPPNQSSSGGNERLLRPTSGVVTSGFGQRSLGYHEGLDFGIPVGSPIISSQTGTVVDVRSSPSYGNLVRVRGADGLETLYAHLSSVGVQPGQQVQQGQQIALSGNTGRSTGPHLHYEVIKDGRRVDPAPMIGAAGEAPRPTQEQNAADAPISAPQNNSAASRVDIQPSTGAQIAQSSTQNEIAGQQITVAATETRPSISRPEQSDPASTTIDPNDPGSVEPEDSLERYSRLFGIAA